MKAAVLALQGAFIEHEQVLQRLGVETVEIRQLKDWTEFMSPSPLGGGRGRLCRLLILPGGESTVQMRLLRELGLFEPIRQAIADGLPVDGIGADVPMTFIRAPYIEKVLADDCSPIAIVDGHIVAARQGNQIATAFHPELDEDLRLHQFLIDMI